MAGMIKQIHVWTPPEPCQSTILDNVGAAVLICVHMNPDRSYELYYLDYPDQPKQRVEVLVAICNSATPFTIPSFMIVHGTLWAGSTQYIVLKRWIPITSEEDLR